MNGFKNWVGNMKYKINFFLCTVQSVTVLGLEEDLFGTGD